MDWDGCPINFGIWGGMDLDSTKWGGLDLGLKICPMKTSSSQAFIYVTVKRRYTPLNFLTRYYSSLGRRSHPKRSVHVRNGSNRIVPFLDNTERSPEIK